MYVAPTTLAVILRGLPRHTRMGVWADDADGMSQFAAFATVMGLTAGDLLAYADSPVRHNGCHEWGDKRSRYIDGKHRRFVRNVVGAHFVPAVDLVQ
jgi:hypothetical protein